MTVLQKSIYQIIKNDEDVFHFIQENSLSGYWFIDLENSSEIYVDLKLKYALGYTNGELNVKDQLLKSNEILSSQELEKVVLSVKSNSNKSLKPINQTVSYLHKEGYEIKFNSQALGVKNSEGKLSYIIVANSLALVEPRPITENQHHIKRLQNIIEGTNIGTWEWNVQTGETIFSEKWANILGYTLEELQPVSTKTWERFAHPEDHERSNKLLMEHFEGITEFYKIESRFKHKNGNWVWVKDSGKVINWTDDGKPKWMTGSHQEITERKEYELLLKKYTDLLEKSNEVAKIGTWEVDLAEEIVTWSKVTKEIHEVSEDYLPKLSQALQFYPSGIHKDSIEEAVKRSVENGENYDLEVEIITAKGNLKWVRAIGISEFKDGKCQRLYGLFQDIQKRKEQEKLNRERQTLQETILNSIEVGVVSCDREGNLTLFNRATREWHGLPVESIPPSEFSNHYGLFHLDGETPLKMEEIPLIQALYTGEVATKEFIISPNNGHRRNVIATGSQLVGEDGNVFGAVIAMKDITNIKKTAQQLKISEATFRGNFENAAIGMAILNERCEWREVNDQLCAITGYTREELLQLSVQEITHPEDLESDLQLLKEFIYGQKSLLNKEARFMHKKGHVIYVILSVSVVKNENGTPLYFISQITDITPRKKAAQELQVALAKLEGILDSSTQVSIIGTDLEGNITTFNKGAENLLGYSREEMIGKETPAIIHLQEEVVNRGIELSQELGEKIENFDVFTALAERGQYETREWTYVRKNGIEFPVQLTVTAIKDKDQIVGYLGVGAEISEIKKAENEIKSLLSVTSDQNDRLKNFAHIVSHNLRSHSGNFAMLLTLFLQEHPEVQENEIMKMLNLASDNLKETIAHLNEVVLINTSIDESLIPLNLFNTTEQAIRNVAAISNESDVSIINNIDPEINILGIQAYLDSIILNFITNGIKYRSLERNSYVKLDAQVKGEYIVINIEDNGLGIDLKKHKAKLFGMYKTFHHNKDSRGIGLFITKNQIESLGGKIEVVSEVDRGTTFKLYLRNEKN